MPGIGRWEQRAGTATCVLGEVKGLGCAGSQGIWWPLQAAPHFRQEIQMDAAQMIASPSDMDVGKIGSHRLNVVHQN